MILYPRQQKQRENSFNIKGYRSPTDWKLKFEDVFITTRDGQNIHGWFLPAKEANSTTSTLLWFHGNAGNIGYRLPFAHHLLHNMNTNVLMLDYRGYGNSEGYPTEGKLTIDGQDTLNYLKTRADVNNDRIFLFGQSLGGAVAIRLAYLNTQGLAGMILENTFSSIDDMVLVILDRIVQGHLSVDIYARPNLIKGLRAFLYLFVTNRWRSVDQIKCVTTTPALFISGALDNLVPPAHMKALYDTMKEGGGDAEMHISPQGDHNDTLASDPVGVVKMKSFIEK